MPTKMLKDFLETNHVKYHAISHSPGYTAQEVAANAHISGKHLAKVVVIKVGDQLALVVLPANGHVNFAELKELTGRSDIDLARESDFKARFPECEVGAMPPFGNLYKMPVYLSTQLPHDKIIFNSGSHSELIEMSWQDFINLVKPEMFTTH